MTTHSRALPVVLERMISFPNSTLVRFLFKTTQVNDAYDSVKRLRCSSSAASSSYEPAGSSYYSARSSSRSQYERASSSSHASSSSSHSSTAHKTHFTAASSASMRQRPSLLPLFIGGCVFVSVLTTAMLAASKPDTMSLMHAPRMRRARTARRVEDGEDGSIRYEVDEGGGDRVAAAGVAAPSTASSSTASDGDSNVQDGRRRYGKK
mmetsp:Transcript_11414/g.24613  ORF Transcript_11414/g.24613 Transcript_11414/m.24613 type:complete len:208 (+) Transcript_11414:129-752(+)